MFASPRVNSTPFGGVLGIKRVCIFNIEVRIEQFVLIFVPVAPAGHHRAVNVREHR